MGDGYSCLIGERKTTIRPSTTSAPINVDCLEPDSYKCLGQFFGFFSGWIRCHFVCWAFRGYRIQLFGVVYVGFGLLIPWVWFVAWRDCNGIQCTNICKLNILVVVSYFLHFFQELTICAFQIFASWTEWSIALLAMMKVFQPCVILWCSLISVKFVVFVCSLVSAASFLSANGIMFVVSKNYPDFP